LLLFDSSSYNSGEKKKNSFALIHIVYHYRSNQNQMQKMSL